MEKCIEKIADMLQKAGALEGVKCLDENGDVVVFEQNVNDYLLVLLLSEMIKQGHIELKIQPTISDERLEYLFQLLDMEGCYKEIKSGLYPLFGQMPEDSSSKCNG